MPDRLVLWNTRKFLLVSNYSINTGSKNVRLTGRDRVLFRSELSSEYGLVYISLDWTRIVQTLNSFGKKCGGLLTKKFSIVSKYTRIPWLRWQPISVMTLVQVQIDLHSVVLITELVSFSVNGDVQGWICILFIGTDRWCDLPTNFWSIIVVRELAKRARCHVMSCCVGTHPCAFSHKAMGMHISRVIQSWCSMLWLQLNNPAIY